jgi:predicted transcriptional regulator
MSIRGTAGAAPRELRDEMPETIAHTTVMTILVRSHERRLLAREHEGRGYRYYPTKSRDGFVSEHTSRHRRGRLAVGSTMSRAGTVFA